MISTTGGPNTLDRGWQIRTALVIPIPVSRMVSVLASLSGMISMRRSLAESSLLGSERASYRILSRASDELEMSSRRKISLLE